MLWQFSRLVASISRLRIGESNMSHWNHRVVKETLPDGSEQFSVRETFYNVDGSIYAYTQNPVNIVCESIEALREYCGWVLAALDKPVLVDGKVEFVERDNDDE